MITVAICEDESYFRVWLEELVRAYFDARQAEASIRAFPDGEALLASGWGADLFLMDIRLPGADGMELVSALRARGGTGQVIFITAYPRYAVQAFALDAVHYLLKPVDRDKLFPALDRAMGQRAQRRGRALLLPGDGGMTRVFEGDILCCEALNHQITVHTLTGRFSFWGALDALEPALGPNFFRCHRSYLVNLNHVAELRPGYGVVTGGGRVLIARRKQRDFARRLLDACQGGMTP